VRKRSANLQLRLETRLSCRFPAI